jgi:hypothetical protein
LTGESGGGDGERDDDQGRDREAKLLHVSSRSRAADVSLTSR